MQIAFVVVVFSSCCCCCCYYYGCCSCCCCFILFFSHFDARTKTTKKSDPWGGGRAWGDAIRRVCVLKFATILQYWLNGRGLRRERAGRRKSRWLTDWLVGWLIDWLIDCRLTRDCQMYLAVVSSILFITLRLIFFSP